MLDSLIQNVLSIDWSVFVLTGGVLLLATELGYRLGAALLPRTAQGASGAKRNLAGGVVGALGLLFGFTFAMAVGRFESRNQLVLEEANGIGTTWLRAGYLSERDHKRNPSGCVDHGRRACHAWQFLFFETHSYLRELAARTAL